MRRKSEIDIKKIIWIYVLFGEFNYFDMIYGVGEHIEITKNNYSYVNLK
jgi:hypothetical protein